MCWPPQLEGVKGSGKRKVESGKWKVESGKRKEENGKWKVESGKWKTENGKLKTLALRLTLSLKIVKVSVIVSVEYS